MNPVTPLSTPAEEYLSWLAVERGRARNTLQAYRRDLVGYEAALAHRGRTPAEADQEDVAAYLAALRQGRSPASVARALSVVRGLHRFMVDDGLAGTDPTAATEAGRLPQRLPKALSEEQVNRLLDATAGTDPLARRDRALLELLYGTGGRVSEIVGLDLTDLHRETGLQGGLVRLYGKGSKERLVPLGRYAAAAVDAWLGPEGRGTMTPKRRADGEAVFLNSRGGRLTRQGAYDVLRRLAVGTGVPVSPHVLRHSCATHMLARGADIRVVQELLGHASITTTQLYTKVTAEHLRAAYEAAHPRAGDHSVTGKL